MGLLGLTAALSLLAAPAMGARESGLGSFTTRVSSNSIVLGQSFSDTATLTPGSSDARTPTGTVQFEVFAPSNPTCDMEIGNVFTSTNPIDSSGVNGVATSDTFTPTVKGTYHVIAFYEPPGDSYYGADSTGCGDPGETVDVHQPIRITGGAVAARRRRPRRPRPRRRARRLPRRRRARRRRPARPAGPGPGRAGPAGRAATCR